MKFYYSLGNFLKEREYPGGVYLHWNGSDHSSHWLASVLAHTHIMMTRACHRSALSLLSAMCKSKLPLKRWHRCWCDLHNFHPYHRLDDAAERVTASVHQFIPSVGVFRSICLVWFAFEEWSKSWIGLRYIPETLSPHAVTHLHLIKIEAS